MNLKKQKLHLSIPVDWVEWLVDKYGTAGTGVRAVIAESFYKDKRGRKPEEIIPKVLGTKPGKKYKKS